MNSFWINSTKNSANFPRIESNFNIDVCIIGAGIFGLSTAYYLCKQGFKVAVLEKDFVGSKASRKHNCQNH